MGAEEVGEVEFRRRSLLHADRGVAQFERRVHLQRLAHQKALAVVVIDAGKVEAERGVARTRPRRVAHQNVDFAGLQRGEAVFGRQRYEFDLVGIVEDRGGDGTADVDVEAGPFALRVRQTKTGERAVGAAVQDAAIFDGFQGLSGGALREEDDGKSENAGKAFHDAASLTHTVTGLAKHCHRRQVTAAVGNVSS